MVTVHDLQSAVRVQALMQKKMFKTGRFEVDAAMCAHLCDFYVFSEEVFH
jgi:hypothetical protein